MPIDVVMKAARLTVFLIFIFTFSIPLWAQSFCTNRGGVRLRRSANPKAEVSWRVARNMPLQGTGKRHGRWLEVRDVDGQKHWVASSDVSRQANCIVIKSRTSRLRTGPGSDFQASPLGQVDRYSTFVDLGGEDGWTQVEDDEGEKAWVNLDHVWKPSRRTRMSFEGS